MSLSEYGWSAQWSASAESARSALSVAVEPGRVVAEHGQVLRVRLEGGELDARLSGTLKHEANDRRDLPAVGDWVLAEVLETHSAARIHALLPRVSSLVRRAAGAATGPQVVAANVDVVAIVSSFGRDINPRRAERYLALAWDSGASPLLIVTKLDLAESAAQDRAELEAVALGVPVLAVSNETGEGLDEVRAALSPGQTVALLGSSGVGKSSLLNRLAGGDAVQTGRIRAADGRGRHTTTHRQLYRTESGLLLIDTPGMRELQPWAAEAVSSAFEDVESLAAGCKFSNCAHQSEPGCALRTAVESGELDSARVESFLKLQRETARLEGLKDHRGRAGEKRFTKRVHRAVRDHPKHNR